MADRERTERPPFDERIAEILDRLDDDEEFRRAVTLDAELLGRVTRGSALARYDLDPADTAVLLALHARGRAREIRRLRPIDPTDPLAMPPDGPGGGSGPDPEPGCFLGETLVATADGPRPIRSIAVGDLVWTRGGLRAVERVHRVEREGIVAVTCEAGEVSCSREHRFHVDGEGWTQARRLRARDVLSTAEGTTRLADTPIALDGVFEVFNLTVERDPEYYVGPGRLRVHNAKPAGP